MPQDLQFNIRDIDNYLYASKIDKLDVSHDFEDTAEFENFCTYRS